MKNNRLRSFAAGCLALLLLGGLRLFLQMPVSAADDKIDVFAQEIAAAESGGEGMQAWVDNVLTPNAGQSGADYYAMAIAAQEGADLSRYAVALRTAIAAQTGAVSATAKERSALALIACDSRAAGECTAILETNAKALGIMSRVYGLHLINNGVSSQKITNNELISEILSMQCEDGGWTVSGSWGDPDVTAMTLQALAPYRSEKSVKPAVDAAIAFLSEKLLESGAFRSYGTENCESTAQAWIALAALGIDPVQDGRFVKNGNSLLEGILQFRVSAGVFSHTLDGSPSALATLQTYLAFVSGGLSHSFYLFHGASPRLSESVENETTSVVSSSVQIGTQTTKTEPQNSVTKSEQTSKAIHIDSSENVTASASQNTYIESTVTTTTITHENGEDTTVSVTRTTINSVSSSETVVLTTKTPESEQKSKYSYRIPFTITSTILFLAIAAFYLMRGKKSAKTYLTIAVIYGAGIAAIWLIRVESPDDYYRTAQKSGGTVTMEIRCDVICGLEGAERFPADGIIMQKTEFSIEENENALTLLYDAVKANELQIEVDGISGDVVETAYVRGIASLYEFDFGDLSGWTYTVNGERPSVGCGAFQLHDGDEVAWIYTINL